MTRGSYSYAYSLGLALSFAGYPLMAAFAEISGLNNTLLSIAIRLIVGIISILIITHFLLKSHFKNKDRILQVAVLFWALYLVRMFNDTLISPDLMFLEPSEYWVWGIGGCVAPMLGFAIVSGQERNGLFHFHWQFAFFLVAAVLISLTASTVVQTDFGEAATGRLNLTALNPISLGHVGTSLFLLSFWALFCWNFPRSWLMIALHAVSILLGLFLMISSNSRGPLVALVLTVAIAAVSLKNSRKLAIVILGLFASAAFVPAVTIIDEQYNTVIYERLFGQSQLEEGNVLERYDRYIIAMESFAQHPFLGSGMEVEAIGGYPHNVVVESFISVGLFGAFVFVALLVTLSIKAFLILKRDAGYGWLSLLFLQYMIGSQFSGAIYSSTTFWAAAGAMIAVAWPANATRKTVRYQSNAGFLVGASSEQNLTVRVPLVPDRR